MSRIGKQPVVVPSGVKIALNPGARTIELTGPKGTVKATWRPEVSVTWTESEKKIVVSTDAHRTAELGHIGYGVEQARRAWLTKADVLNTLPLAKFLRALRPRPGTR